MMRRYLAALVLVGGVAAASGQPPPRPQRPGEIVRPTNRPAQPATEGSAIVRGRVTAADGRALRLARLGLIE